MFVLQTVPISSWWTGTCRGSCPPKAVCLHHSPPAQGGPAPHQLPGKAALLLRSGPSTGSGASLIALPKHCLVKYWYLCPRLLNLSGVPFSTSLVLTKTEGVRLVSDLIDKALPQSGPHCRWGLSSTKAMSRVEGKRSS